MKDSGSLLWPTARASENENRTTQRAPSHGISHGEVLAGVACDMMANWPTPMAGTPAQNGNNAAGNNDFTRKAEELAAAMLWGTPRSSDGEKGGPNQSFGAGGMPLPAQAAQWTTPQAHDVSPRGSGQVPTSAAGNACLARDAMNWPTPSAAQATADAALERHGRGKQIALADFALIFTPPVQRKWTSGVSPSIWRPISRRLLRSATSQVSPTSLRRWLRQGAWKMRRLNPLFVEWLMAWPPGHALCDCSATGFILWQQHMRGALSALPLDSGQWIFVERRDVEAVQQMDLFGEATE